MKLLVVVSAVLSLTTALPQRRVSLKPESQQADDQQTAEQNYNNFQQQEYNRQQQQEYRQQQQQPARPIEDFRPKVSLETTTFIPIIRFDKEQGTDGSYKTAYETGNNIQAEEQGFLKNVGENHDALVQSGSYSYTAPDGQVINVEYTADEFGFRVKGDHIPTPPPVSAEIQKGLDLIYAGIKANQERAAIEAKNNPEAARQQEEKAALDYKGLYYQN
ncbi:endocuticle structural glycoprotein SgAbd-1-like [Pectinophora gossypiella]|uniref:endocuticle structural glycoprotein SgAbd-1-like n=1 Tax=Pectinophora gossypiella TaxID=13191 RepID=UPI00214F363A|nr:endocuticle structural glycoprotein SgAbd-1-like [Pectinophora gossypiella]